jgi:hypothetical protein
VLDAEAVKEVTRLQTSGAAADDYDWVFAGWEGSLG